MPETQHSSPSHVPAGANVPYEASRSLAALVSAGAGATAGCKAGMAVGAVFGPIGILFCGTMGCLGGCLYGAIRTIESETPWQQAARDVLATATPALDLPAPDQAATCHCAPPKLDIPSSILLDVAQRSAS